MGTTTIRIDIETHARLVELSSSAGATLIDTIRDAVEALRRQRFARQVASELQELHNDQAAWDSYVADADATSVSDGLD
ncbi:hypothetical protein HQ535_06375 [bacterium]|nr:hypothetical protein [bacterium]